MTADWMNLVPFLFVTVQVQENEASQTSCLEGQEKAASYLHNGIKPEV
jgi:hypothetical protein